LRKSDPDRRGAGRAFFFDGPRQRPSAVFSRVEIPLDPSAYNPQPAPHKPSRGRRPLKIRNQKDFWSGVMFIACGLFFLGFAREYDFGSAQRMGPAFFPSVLGGLLALIGALIAFQGIAIEGHDGKIEKFHFGPMFWVLGAVVVFGLLLRAGGLLVSIVALVAISSVGSHETRVKEVIWLSIGMAILVYLVFIVGLNLTIPVLPVFLG
jgi:hypothetical protein